MKFPMQYWIVHLVKVAWRKGKALQIAEAKVKWTRMSMQYRIEQLLELSGILKFVLWRLRYGESSEVLNLLVRCMR